MERDGSALAKLGGGMTDTTLVIFMAKIATSHLRMHHCEHDNDDDDCYDDDDNKNDEGVGFAVDGPGRCRRGCLRPHPGKEGVGGGGGGVQR